MSALDDLRSQVAANKSVSDSAIALLNGLHQQLADAIASGDPTAVEAVVTDLKTQTDALAAAVTANTPAAPPGP